VGVRKLCITYSLINMIVPFFGGIPVCHGSGGMAGHYAFGGRTGASVVIYGSLFLLLGLLFGSGFQHIAAIFPLPMLGVILMFEGFALMKRSHDVAASKEDFAAVLLVGLMAAGLPYGFLIAVILGTILVRFYQKRMAAIAENT
jgi:MFS superfamily sulfate permease-like transporter